MKKFLTSLLIIFLCTVPTLIGMKLLNFNKIKSELNFKIPCNRNILVIGNSMGENDLNDSILDNWANRCRGSELYISAMPLLRNFIEANPHIDTVIVTAGLPSFEIFDDKFLNVQKLRWLRSRIAISSSDEIKDYCEVPDRSTFLCFLLSDDKTSYLSTPVLGAFEYLPTRMDTFNKDIQKKSKIGKVNQSYEELISKFSIQVKYLNKIIEYCKLKNKTCILINLPIWKADNWYGSEGYNKLLTTIDPSALIADYSNSSWLPDSCFIDVNHLNGIGATKFSKHIKEAGLKAYPIKEYLKVKGIN